MAGSDCHPPLLQGVYDTGELYLAPVFRSEVVRKTGEPTFEDAGQGGRALICAAASGDVYGRKAATLWLRRAAATSTKMLSSQMGP